MLRVVHTQAREDVRGDIRGKVRDGRGAQGTHPGDSGEVLGARSMTAASPHPTACWLTETLRPTAERAP